ncbi:Conserved mitochondrial protein [Ophiocordyceps camponoti-floridani]|uniref:Conserved mitochondrial protein n=1 Tax=Ophiocordyceps camponoti-floridani TaxID=2030778 RepID=A0A8H4VF77_9HYPO|nr:Conserved mitochondrial protein [Ophiocordyceps camponoti-floridani]
MAKLSASLKELINARHRPIPAPSGIRRVFEKIADDRVQPVRLGFHPWLALSTAATLTLDSPESVAELYSVASVRHHPYEVALLMREVGLKCISFSGIPRAINALLALRAAMPPSVVQRLPMIDDRRLSLDSLEPTCDRGRYLFSSIYGPLRHKLVHRLSLAHPALPFYIIDGHYGALLSNPSGSFEQVPVGRLLTSVIAVACLRAQPAAGPQLLSHVYGLRQAYLDGTWKCDWMSVTADDNDRNQQAIEWLTSNNGAEWLLRCVDTITDALGGRGGSSSEESSSMLPSWGFIPWIGLD